MNLASGLRNPRSVTLDHDVRIANRRRDRTRGLTHADRLLSDGSGDDTQELDAVERQGRQYALTRARARVEELLALAAERADRPGEALARYDPEVQIGRL